MPRPGAGDDGIEGGVAGFPAEFPLNFLGAGNEDGGVSRAAGTDLDGDGVTGDAARRFDDFEHGEARAIAEVVDELLSLRKRLKSKEMGVGQIFDMDVVADAGTVRGGVIVAVDFDLVAAT